MRKDNIYMIIWKASFAVGNIMFMIALFSRWEIGLGIAGIFMLLVPFICRFFIDERANNYSSELNCSSKLKCDNCDKAEACREKVKKLIEQFDEE